MPALSTPDTIAGPLTAADLDAARQHSTGRVLHLRRVHIAGRDTCSGQCETGAGCDCTPLQPAGLDYQGRHETRRFGQQAEFVETMPTDYGALDDCAAVEGGQQRNPAPAMESMWRHRRTRATVGLALALAVVSYLAHLAWPQLGI